MIIHADGLPDHELVEADVCIVGGGPVGLQLARRLAASRLNLIVIESGEETANRRAQDLNIGTQSGRDAGDLRDIRIRQLGGTMHVWGGNCRPLDPIDFVSRDWVPDSGWPVSYSEMTPYFREAHDLLRLEDYSYQPDAPSLLDSEDHSALPFEETIFRLTRFVPGSSEAYLGEFAGYHSAELEAAPELKIFVGATVTHVFLTHDRRSVQELYVQTFQGRELHFRAKAFVFACGGIETARLLLTSTDDAPAGIGNDGDSVGRYFMEHPHGLAALMIAHPDAVPALKPFSPGVRQGDAVLHRRIRLSDATQRHHRLLNMIFQLVAERLKPNAAAQYDPKFRALQASVPDGEAWHRYYVVFLAEQQPTRESRVSLGTQTDFFGMRQVELDWRVSELDYRTVAHSLALLEAQLFCPPRYRLRPYIAGSLEKWRVGHGAHHLGTTRMSASPRDGVVDARCRIHGLANAYCAGSSVFPTAGMSNPMLTSLAVALRLAGHLVTVLPELTKVSRSEPTRRPVLMG